MNVKEGKSVVNDVGDINHDSDGDGFDRKGYHCC